MKVTIKEVARAAGVSVATVSRVLNDSGSVKQDTRSRVQAAAGTLRYIPHGGARSLITRRTNTLGVLLPHLYGGFFSEVIRGIDLSANRAGYHLLVSCSCAHDDRSEMEAALRAMRGRVDGLIVMSPDLDAASLVANLPDSQPVVLLNCAARDGSVDSLTIDNVGGASTMVRHLIGHGCRRVAIIGGPPRNIDARERLRGYRAALREAGIASDPALELPGDFTEASGFEAVQRFVRLHPRPTAIFATNDSMAIGALSALREAGVRVPEDVAVAGFDDIPIARYMSPSLSSVHVPIAELGEHAMRKLLGALGDGNGHVHQQEVLDTTLVIRNSCGAHGHAAACAGRGSPSSFGSLHPERIVRSSR